MILNKMAWKNAPIRRLVASACQSGRAKSLSRPRVSRLQPSRGLHVSAARCTDGVFRGLSDDRLSTPWIEAWRALQDGRSVGPPVPGEAGERDLSPKKMSDSYHRVVLPLGRDPWLSDTYINASGHIRYGEHRASLTLPS